MPTRLAFFIVASTVLFSFLPAHAQQATTPNQTISGQVVDVDTQAPLIGVNVIIIDSTPLIGASTDADGRFTLPGIAVGRASIQFTYLGFEPQVVSDVLVTAGKEVVLNIALQEAVIQTTGIEVVAEAIDGIATNEMALVSARSFSVEQTQRYAASVSDPARMAQTFAGVAGGGDDLQNAIVVRGNAPKGLLWRLEGIEIPNPNHFGEEGASGGGISMLSASTLTRSDFYTGAFPAEYGNALSGVFDLALRNGNSNKQEYSIQAGALGVEASLEGPFRSGYGGSYLVNYRYSTLGILNNFGVLPDESIQYQDLSFKLNFPLKNASRLTLFGLAGDAEDIYDRATRDSTTWTSQDDAFDGEFTTQMAVVGASHLWLLGKKTYLKTTAAIAAERRQDYELELIPSEQYRAVPLFEQDTQNWAYRMNVQLNHKMSAQATLHLGLVASSLGYSLNNRTRDTEAMPWTTFLASRGQTQMLQSHAQFKLRPSSSLTVTPGLHYTYFALNGNHLIEPRLGLSWQLTANQALSLGMGLHSRREGIAVYLLERTRQDGTTFQPHQHLDLARAWHFVLGYDRRITPHLRFKIETYYQYLFDVPVGTDRLNPRFSSLNAESIWAIVFSDDELINEGTARNYGVEMTIERFLGNGYYALATGSLYQAEYTPLDGRTYNSRYAGNYVANFVAGKEFTLSQKSLLGLNVRFIYAGGNRYTPLDRITSETLGYPVLDRTRPYENQLEAYYRLDAGISYTINRSAATHAIRFDIQNVTGRENIQGFDYNEALDRVAFTHAGLIPVLSYQFSF